MTPLSSKSHVIFLAGYLLHHKKSYGLGIIFIFLTNWLAVNIPQYIGVSIDLLNTGLVGNQPLLNRNIAIIIIFAICMIAARTISRILFFNPGRAIEKELKDDAFFRLTMLQKSFHDKHETGGIISIVNNDVSGIRALSGVVMLQIFNITFALSLTPLKMWQISPDLTLFCMVPVIIAFIISHKAILYMRNTMKKRMVDLQELSSNTVGFLSGIEVIKSNQIYQWAQKEFAKNSEQLLNRSILLAKLRTLVLPILAYTDRIMRVLILSVGGMFVIRANLSLGELVAFLSYATLLAMPFFSMGMIFSAFQNGLASINSLRKILDEEVPLLEQQHLNNQERNSLFGLGINIQDLSYTYPENSEPSLKNICFKILPGQKIGILGPVGSGKSTLVNCINRHLEIKADQIFLDEYDITKLSRKDLRSAIRTITQEPFLFSDSVSNNIRFSAGNKESMSIEDVLYQCKLSDEVGQFPAGEDTLIGEKGILLSGGQKQRLSLARAMYSPCKLMILDNVLSAVDNETERFLLTHIFENMKAQSLLIVSHRASVLEKVDLILVLEEGEIVAQGSHQQLLVNSPIYRKTWELQQHESADLQEAES